MDKPVVRDGALFVFRCVIGFVFAAHGYQKLFVAGPGQTTAYFLSQQIPQPALAAWLTAICELVGGILLIIGLVTTIAAGVLAVIMVGAFWFVTRSGGLFVATGGSEYVVVLWAALVTIVVFGPGRASIDGAVGQRD
ncbi:DoxX family protein [Corynebacterium mendelii]|uniref:DoxX family protein n=1 Tax=Corynebacterium mendelii TaxID=2765362 RepID=A0A939E0K2_9CORY|nr:DoxX family protein [Corynebacterium mendelii]MBN9644724.1 DoxX family protein [Corynebacterium mendelii]